MVLALGGGGGFILCANVSECEVAHMYAWFKEVGDLVGSGIVPCDCKSTEIFFL